MTPGLVEDRKMLKLYTLMFCQIQESVYTFVSETIVTHEIDVHRKGTVEH